MPLATDRVVQGVVALALVLPALLFLPNAADPVNIVKMTALVLCALDLAAAAVWHLVTTRRVRLPWGLPAAAAALLLVALTIAAVRAPATGPAVLGAYGRNNGWLAYAAALVVYLAVISSFSLDATRVVLYALMASGGFTASYGLLQYFGVDAVEWNTLTSPVIAALGNANFAAGYLAISLPAFVWGAVRRGSHAALRAGCAAAAVLAALVAVLTDAVQGPMAAAAGAAVFTTAWLLERESRARAAGLLAILVPSALAVTVLGWGATGGGPAASVFADEGSRARGWFWQVALSAWRDQPLLGVGLENFALPWRTERSLAAIRGLGGEDVTDAAHSVPLHLLATGGLLLFLAYLAFLGVTAWALVAGLRRLRGEERLLLGALGGCWAAYQVQSFVSIDQVPLLVTHYALAGAIIVASGRARTRQIPAQPARASLQGKGPRKKARGRPVASVTRPLTPVTVGVLSVGAAVALLLAWQALVPLRADIAAHNGDVALKRGDGTPALAAYGRATDLLPGEPRYWYRLGQLLLRAEQPQQALQAHQRGIEADPNDVPVVRGATRAAEAAGDLELAGRYHRRALELHPDSPSTVIAAANFEFQQGRTDNAAELLDGAVRTLPEEATLWAALGELRAATGQQGAAREALQRALALDPGVPGAAERLAELDGAPS